MTGRVPSPSAQVHRQIYDSISWQERISDSVLAMSALPCVLPAWRHRHADTVRHAYLNALGLCRLCVTANLSFTHCTGLRSVFLLLLLASLLLRLPPLHKLPQLAHIRRNLAKAEDVLGDMFEAACYVCHQRVGASINGSRCLNLQRGLQERLAGPLMWTEGEIMHDLCT